VNALRLVAALLFVGAANLYVFRTAGPALSPVLAAGGPDTSAATATPIKHLVVIFQENVSFDHYFGTYPNATNPPGEPRFTAAPDTPSVNGLTEALLTRNPNGVGPFRLDRTQAWTCDQDHDYTDEQKAFDSGLMDKFSLLNGSGGSGTTKYCPSNIVMGYYDGNTVTGLWNYAQHFAMSDNSYGSTFGPSTPGVLNLISGDTSGAACGPSDSVYNAPAACNPSMTVPSSPVSGGTVIGDPDQFFDDYSSGGKGSKNTALMTGRNIGDLLNTAGLTWGWFNGGFDNPNAKHNLAAYDRAIGVNPATDTTTLTADYSAHHEGFQYYKSTSNPHHTPPSSLAMIGKSDVANHQYDLADFWTAADAGNLPAVSFLKAARYQDGHASNSDPLDEQEFLVDTINHLETLSSWSSTAVVIAYDDSDGWYDHVMGPIVNHSATSADAGCGSTTDGTPARCGYGPRLPLLVISPYSRQNFVDHTVTDQSSILRFIEDNWLKSQRIDSQSFDNFAGPLTNLFDFSHQRPDFGRLYLDPQTGEVTSPGSAFASGHFRPQR
jgi:phospholipase C